MSLTRSVFILIVTVIILRIMIIVVVGRVASSSCRCTCSRIWRASKPAGGLILVLARSIGVDGRALVGNEPGVVLRSQPPT